MHQNTHIFLAGIVEVFYNVPSYEYWQKVGWNPCRHLCLQNFLVRDGVPVLTALTMSKKRAVDSRMFGKSCTAGALPSDRSFLDVEMILEFYRLLIAEKTFSRMKDSSGWKTRDAGYSVYMPIPVFAAVIEKLGTIRREVTHVLVTVSHSSNLFEVEC